MLYRVSMGIICPYSPLRTSKLRDLSRKVLPHLLESSQRRRGLPCQMVQDVYAGAWAGLDFRV